MITSAACGNRQSRRIIKNGIRWVLTRSITAKIGFLSHTNSPQFGALEHFTFKDAILRTTKGDKRPRAHPPNKINAVNNYSKHMVVVYSDLIRSETKNTPILSSSTRPNTASHYHITVRIFEQPTHLFHYSKRISFRNPPSQNVAGIVGYPCSLDS
jgi:hypothetical protein